MVARTYLLIQRMPLRSRFSFSRTAGSALGGFLGEAAWLCCTRFAPWQSFWMVGAQGMDFP